MHKGDAEDDSDAKHASQQEKTFEAGPLPERARTRNAIKPVLAIVTSLYDKEKNQTYAQPHRSMQMGINDPAALQQFGRIRI